MEPEDLLNYENEPEIMQKIGSEKIYYSDKIVKRKKAFFGKDQERNLLITNTAIYNFKKKEIKRRIKLEDLYGITYARDTNQFVIHFNENDYDYLLISENRDKIICFLQYLYEKIKGADLLFSIKNDKDLTKYVVTKSERRKNPYLFKLDKNELTPIKEFFKDSGIEFEENNNNNYNNYGNDSQEQEKPKGFQMIGMPMPGAPRMPRGLIIHLNQNLQKKNLLQKKKFLHHNQNHSQKQNLKSKKNLQKKQK